VLQLCHVPVQPFDCLDQGILFCNQLVLLIHALASLQRV
jgi:hypothetical protein